MTWSIIKSNWLCRWEVCVRGERERERERDRERERFFSMSVILDYHYSGTGQAVESYHYWCKSVRKFELNYTWDGWDCLIIGMLKFPNHLVMIVLAVSVVQWIWFTSYRHSLCFSWRLGKAFICGMYILALGNTLADVSKIDLICCRLLSGSPFLLCIPMLKITSRGFPWLYLLDSNICWKWINFAPGNTCNSTKPLLKFTPGERERERERVCVCLLVCCFVCVGFFVVVFLFFLCFLFFFFLGGGGGWHAWIVKLSRQILQKP